MPDEDQDLLAGGRRLCVRGPLPYELLVVVEPDEAEHVDEGGGDGDQAQGDDEPPVGVVTEAEMECL